MLGKGSESRSVKLLGTSSRFRKKESNLRASYSAI